MQQRSSRRPVKQQRLARTAERLEARTMLSVAPPAFAAGYQSAWLQDFRTQSALSVSAYGPTGPGGTAWMAHKVKSGDFFDFKSPSGNLNPFGVDSSGLTIRSQKNGNPNNGFGGYTGGILSSLDDAGNGFAQQYGYFEISMKLPGGANTWPAFWLVSRNGEVASGLDVSEIDVMEGYGNWDAGPGKAGDPNHYIAGYHNYGANGTHTGDGHAVDAPGAATGYHTYGVDIEPTGITYYFDRSAVWTAPIYDAATHPMYVLVDLALGGGNYNNANGTGYDWNLTPNPSDLKVQYVSVWASPASPNYDPALSGNVSGATIGTKGSYSTGNTGVYTAPDGANAAFDGDVNTFFNAPAANDAWAGQDLGSARQITRLTFAPRAGKAGLMLGGKFQVSNSPDFSSGNLTLYTVETTPADGLQTIDVNSGTAFRYVRYLSPNGSFGNVAEVSFAALGGLPAVTGLAASAPAGLPVTLTWNAVTGATGYNVYRGTTPGGEGATPIASNVGAASYVDQDVASGVQYYYQVAAVNAAGIGGLGGEVSAKPNGSVLIDLTGTTIGTTGSWQSGSTGVYSAKDGANAVFDGSVNTYFDAPFATGGNGAWVGLDLGSPKIVSQIRYAPRDGFQSRMDGGKFQASSTPDFSSDVVTLYTVTGTPSLGLKTANVSSAKAYRYVRYLSPNSGWGNLSELSFRGFAAAAGSPPAAPTRLFARPQDNGQVKIFWSDLSNDETGFVIDRKVGNGAWTQIATVNANVTTYANGGLSGGTTYTYRVRAVNAYGESADSNEATVITRPVNFPISAAVAAAAEPDAERPLGVMADLLDGTAEEIVASGVALQR